MTEIDRDLAELQRRANRIHNATPGAEDAPPELWQRVLAQVQPQTQETQAMSSARFPAQTPRTPRLYAGVGESTPTTRRGFSHYLNLAATVALVAAVAIGGWFAMVQINQPNTPEPRFAALGFQPEVAGNGVCDVEPLTVDESIAILKNPMEYLSRDFPADLNNPLLNDGGQGNYLFLSPPAWDVMNEMMPTSSTSVVESEFNKLQPIANEYLDCLHNGTRGQFYRLNDPVVLQYVFANRLPVLVSEEEARVQLAELLEQPMGTNVNELPVGLRPQINPDRAESTYIAASFTLHTHGIYIIPLMYVDEQGTPVLISDLEGTKNPDQSWSRLDPMNLVIGQSSLDQNWYVVGAYRPDQHPVNP